MIYYLGNTPSSPSLSHHGILGMHWGERHGPPYPLDYESHSKAEKQQNPKRLISAGGDPSSEKKVSSAKQNGMKQKSHRSDASKPSRTDSETTRRKSSESQTSNRSQSDDDFARQLLSKNPNAAVVNPGLKEWARTHKKEIAIGVGVAAAVGVGIILAKHGKMPVKDIKAVTGIKPSKVLAETKVSDISKDFGGFKSNEQRFLAQWFKADMHRFDAITTDEFAKMSNEGVSLNTGEKLFRMSKGNHATLRDGIEYVSFGEDRERYKGFLPQMWRANGAVNKRFFESELEALTGIKAPGKKESVEILEAALKKTYPHSSDQAIHDMALKQFYRVQAQLIDRNYVLGKMYLSEAQSRGYNAVIDWNDAGRLADKPLILMNGAKQASIQKVQQYDIKETRELFRSIKLPSNAADFKIEEWNAEKLRTLYEPLFGRFMA